MVLVQRHEHQDPQKDIVFGLNLDLLRPRILSDAEKARKKKLLGRLAWACLAILAWAIGLYSTCDLNRLSLLLQARKLEKASIESKISALRSSAEPAEVHKIREELRDQVNWATRLSDVGRIVPEGCKVTQISVKKDGNLELGGEVSDVQTYGLLLESLRQVGFIKEVVSASLTASDAGFSFKIVATTTGAGGA